jgi:hypothetical protein
MSATDARADLDRRIEDIESGYEYLLSNDAFAARCNVLTDGCS